jgi:hypothetical protein
VTINLINRLVERGLLTADDAKELIAQAEADAAEAQAPANDTVSVTYVPEIVRMQIRDEIKADMLKQAREENWAAPKATPGWVSRFGVKGDIRVRYEGLYYPGSNDNSAVFWDFNRINSGSSPYDFSIANLSYWPTRNVDQDRERMRLLARLGAEINLDNGFTAGLRLASGDNSSPVSANQSMGASGGNFSKYAIWLDRAFLKYENLSLRDTSLSVVAGRFDNPFFAPSEILWDNDLGFDGVALQAKRKIVEGVTLFGSGGVFPIFNTDLNFSSTRPEKYPSTDKWLYGVQGGINWKINRDLNFRGAVAFHEFDGVAGQKDTPRVYATSTDQGATDNTRPAFAQFGNTYFPLRSIIPNADNDFGNKNQWQFFGLATKFRNLDLAASLNYEHFEPFVLSLYGEFVKNLAWDGDAINAKDIVNNFGTSGDYLGGDTGWIVGLKVGHAALQKRWDWNLALSYRYVESDAVIDGFCDSDFGGGGTNVKGFSVGGSLALAPRIIFGLRWMGSDQVAGPSLHADTFQVDISAKF